MRDSPSSFLEIEHVTKRFGGLTALENVSFNVAKGEIRGLIGPNGAGKSTMFKIISGFYKPASGQIRFNGHLISGKKPCNIARYGIVRTFQETTLFQEMTVYDNILVGGHLEAKTNVVSSILGFDRAVQASVREKTFDVLEFMGLIDQKDQLAAELPLGSQRALAVAIALMSQPELLLLDEPFAGMNPNETQHMMDLTLKVQQSGVTIVLVEHDMRAVMGLCGYLSVLNFGTLLAQGTPEEIRYNDDVISAYLGGGKAH